MFSIRPVVFAFCSRGVLQQYPATAVTRPLAQTTTTFLRTFSGDSAADDDVPPPVVLERAMELLDDFSGRLDQLAGRIDEKHLVTVENSFTTRELSLPEITLHSRDATEEDFAGDLARAAREQLLPEAIKVHDELDSLITLYQTTVWPQMTKATQICQETPCGGASWEIDMDSLMQKEKEGATKSTPSGHQTLELGGLADTPCGRLQLTSMNFLEATRRTQPQIVMGSRAKLILQLAMEFNTPLKHIRFNGSKEQNQKVKDTFQTQVLPTPWIRSEEEYQHLMQIQDELKGKNKM